MVGDDGSGSIGYKDGQGSNGAVKAERITRKLDRITGADGIGADELRELKETVPQFVGHYQDLLGLTDRMKARLLEDRKLLESYERDLAEAREALDQLTSPPFRHGTLYGFHDGEADVALSSSEHLRVGVNPRIPREELSPGKAVLLDPQSSAVVRVLNYQKTGTSARVKDVLPDGRVVVTTSMGNTDTVVYLGGIKPNPGDVVLLDRSGTYAVQSLPSDDRRDLYVEYVKPVNWADVGGLDSQIEQLRELVIYPYTHADIYDKYDIPGKGVLLQGPPGCGKTYMVKGLVTELFGLKKAGMNIPVVVFFDEADSLFAARGSGISVVGGAGGTMSDTIVPALLAELDGLEDLNRSGRVGLNGEDARPFFYYVAGPEVLNMFVGASEEAIRNIYRSARRKSDMVVTVLATNRPDKLDPALLRDERFDSKILVPRPNEAAARQILGVYLKDGLPVARSELSPDWYGRAIDQVVQYIYRSGEPLLRAEYRDGNPRDLTPADFASGAKLRNIVRRAARSAARREVEGGEPGITYRDLGDGARSSYAEDVEIMTTGSPQKWSLILGKDGDNIMRVTPAPRYSTGAVQQYKPRTTAV